MRSPYCSQIELSPDGSHLSMILHKKNMNTIGTIKLANKALHYSKGIPGQHVHAYDWVDGDHMLIETNLWGIAYTGMHATDESLKRYEGLGPATFNYEFQTYFADNVYRVVDPLLLAGGKALLADSTHSGDFPDLVYYDVEGDSLTGRMRNDGNTVGWYCDAGGVIRIIQKLTNPGDSKLYYRESEADDYKEFSLGVDSVIHMYDSRMNRLFVSYENDQDRRVFQIFDLGKMEYVGKEVSHPEFACSPEILRDRGTRSMVGAVYNMDKPMVAYFDRDYRSLHEGLSKLEPGATVRILGTSDQGTILFETSSDKIPMTVFEYDPKGASIRESIHQVVGRAPWIKKEVCSSMTPVTFESRDGKTIHAYLTRSLRNPDQPGPTVMLVHGGPMARDSWGFDSEVQFLAYLGYHVIQVNYRGSSGFNPDYSIENYLEICHKAVEDVSDGARWAIREGIADPERLAIVGGSFGGYTALASAAFEPDLYKVAIGFAGVYNFDRQLREDYKDEDDVRKWLGPFIGDIENNPDLYHDISPVNFADKIKARVLLMHGGADTRVSAKQTKLMSKALDDAGVEHDVDISSWGLHGFYNDKESRKYGTRLGEFLRDNL